MLGMLSGTINPLKMFTEEKLGRKGLTLLSTFLVKNHDRKPDREEITSCSRMTSFFKCLSL